MSTDRTTSRSSGISLGAAFALMLSWTAYHSFWWAVLHGFFGWFYVAYYLLIANYDAAQAVMP